MAVRTKDLILTVVWAITFSIVISIVFISITGLSEDSLRILIRTSAKISLITFLLAFSASSIHHLFNTPVTTKLLAYRPRLGLLFAVFHFAHLLFLVFLQFYAHPVFVQAKTSSLLAGGFAYFMILLMAMTTFPLFKKMLSIKAWKILHLIGGYWIWIIFFRSNLLNVVNKDRYHFLLALLVIVLILRIISGLKRTSLFRS